MEKRTFKKGAISDFKMERRVKSLSNWKNAFNIVQILFEAFPYCYDKSLFWLMTLIENEKLWLFISVRTFLQINFSSLK